MVDWSFKFAYGNKLKGDILVSQEYSTVKVKLQNARRKFGNLMDAADSNKLLRIFNEFQCILFVLLLEAPISFNL